MPDGLPVVVTHQLQADGQNASLLAFFVKCQVNDGGRARFSPDLFQVHLSLSADHLVPHRVVYFYLESQHFPCATPTDEQEIPLGISVTVSAYVGLPDGFFLPIIV